MHDMGIPFHPHEGINTDRSLFRHTPHVIAAQIHEHHMFRSLFLICEQFLLQHHVLIRGRTSLPGSRDRPD